MCILLYRCVSDVYPTCICLYRPRIQIRYKIHLYCLCIRIVFSITLKCIQELHKDTLYLKCIRNVSAMYSNVFQDTLYPYRIRMYLHCIFLYLRI